MRKDNYCVITVWHFFHMLSYDMMTLRGFYCSRLWKQEDGRYVMLQTWYLLLSRWLQGAPNSLSSGDFVPQTPPCMHACSSDLIETLCCKPIPPLPYCTYSKHSPGICVCVTDWMTQNVLLFQVGQAVLPVRDCNVNTGTCIHLFTAVCTAGQDVYH